MNIEERIEELTARLSRVEIQLSIEPFITFWICPDCGFKSYKKFYTERHKLQPNEMPGLSGIVCEVCRKTSLEGENRGREHVSVSQH